MNNRTWMRFLRPVNLMFQEKKLVFCKLVLCKLQIDGFVPIDNVTRKAERFNADNMYVASIGTQIQPFTLKRQMHSRQS